MIHQPHEQNYRRPNVRVCWPTGSYGNRWQQLGQLQRVITQENHIVVVIRDTHVAHIEVLIIEDHIMVNNIPLVRDTEEVIIAFIVHQPHLMLVLLHLSWLSLYQEVQHRHRAARLVWEHALW
jgi:hypothetical protein